MTLTISVNHDYKSDYDDLKCITAIYKIYNILCKINLAIFYVSYICFSS